MGKKIASFFVLSLLIISLSGCIFDPGGIIDSIKYNNYIKDKANKNYDRLIICFEEQNKEELRSMLCAKLLSSDNIDEEISSAFEKINGIIVQHKQVFNSIGESKEKGRIVKYDISPTLEVVTDTNETFVIVWLDVIKYDDKPDKEGISYIKIYYKDEKICQIGDYYLVNPELK